MASRAGRLKERGKRGKHGSPEGEGGGERHGTGRLKERGGGERHAPAKPRLVAVLGVSFVSLASSKYRRAHIVFLRPPLLRAIGLPTSPFSLLSPSTDGLTLSFSAPLSFRLLDCLLSLSLYFPQVPTGSLYLSPSPLPFGLLDYHTLLNCFST